MASANDIIAKAKSQLGYKEKPVNNTAYGQWYGLNPAPWCAMFVSWVFAMCGMPLPVSTSKGFAYTPYGVDYFKKIGRWSTTPHVGALVFYKFGSRVDHVEIVTAINPDGSIVTVGGNTNQAGSRTGGEVAQQTRRSKIVGYGLPAYSQSSQPTPNNPTPTNVGVSDMSAVAYDEISGGNWTIDETGAIFANDGAPYCGGLNGRPDLSVFPGQNGHICGVSFWKGNGTDHGGNGIVIVYRFNNSGAPSTYHFSRDGSDIPKK